MSMQDCLPLARGPDDTVRDGVPNDTSQLAAIAQEDYASRRRRDRIFGTGIFAEPAWDMLLDLYIQEHIGRPVSIHSLCIAAAVPPTTALRWIGRLVGRGSVVRTPSPRDHRVVHVALTAEGRNQMETYLRERMRVTGARP